MPDRHIESDFSNFSPEAYLQEYYDHIGSENDGLLRFFAEAFSRVPPETIMLEFGGGPTVYQLISAAPRVMAIDFADYLDANLEEVRRWKDNLPGAFDWSPFISYALQLEGHNPVTSDQIAQRADVLRSKLRRFLHVDAHSPHPLREDPFAAYDLVSVNFVPEGITQTREAWVSAVLNICSLIKPGGKMLMSAIEGATHWRVGKVTFPAVSIGGDDIHRVLDTAGFSSVHMHSIPAEVLNNEEENFEGYLGIVFIEASR